MDGDVRPGPETVVAARHGDQAALDRLIAGYLPLVYNIVGRALDGHADVDDVVQETMLRVVHGLEGLRDPDSFRSWLVAIAMRQVRDHWRRGRTTPAGGLDGMDDVADPGADFADLTILRLGLSGQRREVAEATRWLGPEDRELLSLWWLEAAGELTRAELAAALDLPPAHAAVRVQRMKAQLETARAVVRALHATPRCPDLAALTASWDGAPDPVWRKRLARHTRDCTACGAGWSGVVPAERLLTGLALVPLPAGFTLYGAAFPGGHAASTGAQAGSGGHAGSSGGQAGPGGSHAGSGGAHPASGGGHVPSAGGHAASGGHAAGGSAPGSTSVGGQGGAGVHGAVVRAGRLGRAVGHLTAKQVAVAAGAMAVAGGTAITAAAYTGNAPTTAARPPAAERPLTAGPRPSPSAARTTPAHTRSARPTRRRAKPRPVYGSNVDTVDRAPAKNASPGRLPVRAEGRPLVFSGKWEQPFRGSLGGRYLMFYRDDHLTIRGRGYFQVRWEIAYFNRPGMLVMPTWTGLKGKIFHVASGGGRRMDDAVPGATDRPHTWMGRPDKGYITLPQGAQQMWQNEFYYIDGEVTLRQHERGADYNLGITPVSRADVAADIGHAPDPAHGVVRRGLVRDTGRDDAPVPQYATREDVAAPDVPQRSRLT
ncbi:hypothetical protein GCM10023196_039550 [Actinoallomurus vinaceus]|uniref:RNA polymerase sigma-70 region 2 domain-containing protein n=1 Tax=Actinoallomurus vinaceus TaxID=1080074 RepID=A0ABP8UAN8_9ACTN